MEILRTLTIYILKYYNGSLLPKRNVILQPLMYCNFTTDGDTALQQIYTCIAIPKNYFISTVILFYNTSTLILHYILIIKLHQNIVKPQTFSTV